MLTVCVPPAVRDLSVWASRLSLDAQRIVASFVIHIPRCGDCFLMIDGAFPIASPWSWSRCHDTPRSLFGDANLFAVVCFA
jgi:hypothetical protein